MRAPVLRPRGRQAPEPLALADFGPSHAADFVAPLAGQDQQPDDSAIVVLPAGVPDVHQLAVGQERSRDRSSIARLVAMTGLASTRPSRIAQVNSVNRLDRARFAA
jgi:hypothetical protein